MYKTWNSMKNRNIILDILNGLILNKNIFDLIFSNRNNAISQELEVIESLCDHECIREEIKIKLREVFRYRCVVGPVSI